MSTEVYYFSGTGNSLHVAKELQKRIPESKLIPIVSLQNKAVIETNAETVGFVFPIHQMTVPAIVKSIIAKLDLTATKYIFVIATRFGTPCNCALKKIEKILAQKGKSLDAHLFLNMASNDPKFKNWHPATKDEIAKLETVVQERLNTFTRIITDKVKYREEDTNINYPMNFMIEGLGSFFADTRGYAGENFYADAKCSGCGICAKVCLSAKIKVIDDKPVWQKKSPCFLCYACINYCPQQAIQVKPNSLMGICTENKGRYFYPDITANDIASQKNG